ncbi:hypothetical protein QFC22_002112 [Naganishia vaughanmartiniae]|uniref:Uncharacterized protein n=1 Tax=Naganishia vaughanmartiniae TaxID=1424756 RepID=A0ACC2XEM7_9TREE|nr:hypothetical protein QFC22_002112 [Naganishia vaughanmartiniae]
MAIPTPPSAPTPVTPGVDVQIEGPTDLAAKIVKHLAEKDVGQKEDEVLRPLDCGQRKQQVYASFWLSQSAFPRLQPLTFLLPASPCLTSWY